MFAWQFLKAQHAAERNGWTRFVSMQDYYNLIYREEEREMLPMCAAEGIAVIPWSPMARGRLTRDWSEQTERQRSDDMMARLYPQSDAADRKVAEQVAAIAGRRGVPRAQIALAWVLSKPIVTAPIIGASKPNHLDDAVAALSIKLTDEEMTALESPYVPHAVVGFA
jgi:aryl-alcohol dehydrogenase-like predicted oxidoreductase